MYAIRFYRIYDIGEEIDLAALERGLAESMAIARAGFVRVHPKSISMVYPPLLIRLQSACIEHGGRSHEFTVVAKVFDIGAISLCMIHEKMDAPAAALEEAALRFANQEGLDAYFSAALTQMRAILKPQIGDRPIDPDFYEDYTIYIADRLDPDTDPVAVMLGEKTEFAPEIRNDILKYTLSYNVHDQATLSWAGALLVDREPPTDLIELIEFATVQVLELRFYDRELSRQMAKMFDDIENAGQLSRLRRMRRYRLIMKELMRIQAEISEITEKVNNLIKVTEDVYYARVYATALAVLRSQTWNESVNRRIAIIRENYAMLSEEVNVQHSNFLEWIVIVLIAFEIILFLLPVFPH
jgi:ribosome-binding factor A